MVRLLFQIVTGPENVTKGALGLLVAKTAREGGHDVNVFLAGDGVDYLRVETQQQASGVGTGNVGEHFDALVAGGARLFASGMSAAARGIAADDSVKLVKPPRLVELIVAADKVVVY